MSRALRAAFIVFVSWPLTSAVAGDGVEIRADRVETVQEEGGPIRTYLGNVVARLDSGEVRSGQAVFRPSTNEIVFSLGVEGSRAGRRVTADSLRYALHDLSATAEGGVLVAEGGRELRARWVRLAKEPTVLEAVGEAEVRFPEGQAHLSADSVLFSPGGDSGVAVGNARLVRLQGDTVGVSARRIRFREGGRGSVAEGSVAVRAGAFEAFAETAAGDSSSTLMSGSPVLKRTRHTETGVEYLEVRGVRMGLFTGGGRLREVLLRGSARAVLRGFRADGTPSAESLIEGDTLRVVVDGDGLKGVTSQGSARCFRRDADSSTVELRASRIGANLDGGVLRGVEGEGKARVSHASPDGLEKGELAGDRIRVRMAGDRVAGVVTSGRATLEYVPDLRVARKKGGKSRLAGERIELWLKDGTLQRAAVERAVAGTYWMTDEEQEGK